MTKRGFGISANWACVIVGVLALLYMIMGSYIRGEFKRRSFELNPGLTHLQLGKHNPDIVKGPTTWMVFVSSEDHQMSTVVVVPYAIINTGDRDIRNIALQLTYPVEHAVSRDMMEEYLRPKEEDYWSIRKVTRFAGRAVVRYEIPILRVGENSVVGDPMLLTYSGIGDVSQDPRSFDPDTTLEGRLAQHLPLLGYVNVHETVTAEEMDPLSSALHIVWISKKARDIDIAWLDALVGIYSAVWSGRKGPELVFENPMSDLVRFGGGFSMKPKRDFEVPFGASFELERVELVELDLFSASMKPGLSVLVERAGASYRVPSEMPIPRPDTAE